MLEEVVKACDLMERITELQHRVSRLSNCEVKDTLMKALGLALIRINDDLSSPSAEVPLKITVSTLSRWEWDKLSDEDKSSGRFGKCPKRQA